MERHFLKQSFAFRSLIVRKYGGVPPLIGWGGRNLPRNDYHLWLTPILRKEH